MVTPTLDRRAERSAPPRLVVWIRSGPAVEGERVSIAIGEDRQMLADTARRFVAEQCAPDVARAAMDRPGASPAALLGAAGRARLDRPRRRRRPSAARATGSVSWPSCSSSWDGAVAPGPALPTMWTAAVLQVSARRRAPGTAGCAAWPAVSWSARWPCRDARTGRRHRERGPPARSSARAVADLVVAAGRRRRDPGWCVVRRRGREHHRPGLARRHSRRLAPVDLDGAHASPSCRRASGTRWSGDRHHPRRRRGCRRRRVVRRHRGRVRRGPTPVRPPDRPVPGREAPVRRHARARWSRPAAWRGTQPRRSTATTRTAPRPAVATAAAGAIALDAVRDRGQGLHPGARRHRLHLGARRPPVPAPGDGAAPAARRHRSRWRRRHRGRGARRHPSPPRSSSCRPRPRRCAPRCAPRSRRSPRSPKAERRAPARRRRADRARTGRRRGAAARARSSSSSSTRSSAGPRSGCRTSRSARGRRRPSPRTAPPSSRSAGSARRSTARSAGASCSASPRPAPTWRRSPPRPTRTDGGWLLNGQKVWTTMATEADWGICLARTEPDRAEAPRHHLLHGRHVLARASTSARCAS